MKISPRLFEKSYSTQNYTGTLSAFCSGRHTRRVFVLRARFVEKVLEAWATGGRPCARNILYETLIETVTYVRRSSRRVPVDRVRANSE